eukprot:SAG31_NODE_3913_length_3756_cov_1.959256_8_plen_118_part_00
MRSFLTTRARQRRDYSGTTATLPHLTPLLLRSRVVSLHIHMGDTCTKCHSNGLAPLLFCSWTGCKRKGNVRSVFTYLQVERPDQARSNRGCENNAVVRPSVGRPEVLGCDLFKVTPD